VAGCSGSPVYLDGRLAGALAFAWTYSKDPLYGATPIEDMLKVGTTNAGEPGPAFAFDYSKPIDFGCNRQADYSASLCEEQRPARNQHPALSSDYLRLAR